MYRAAFSGRPRPAGRPAQRRSFSWRLMAPRTHGAAHGLEAPRPLSAALRGGGTMPPLWVHSGHGDPAVGGSRPAGASG